jgi:hypothetical protein
MREAFPSARARRMKPLWREPVQAPISRHASTLTTQSVLASVQMSDGKVLREEIIAHDDGQEREHAIDGSAKPALLAVTERTTASPMQQPHRGG